MPICDCLMWLGLVLAVYCFPNAGGQSVSQLYPFGVAAGDQTLERSDEGSSSVITLATPFTFFGTAQSFAYVSPCLYSHCSLQGMLINISQLTETSSLIITCRH